MKELRDKRISPATEMLMRLEEGKEQRVYENYTEVYKEITFSASHLLPKHARDCKYLHGHTYRVGITLGGYLERELNKTDTGMVIDFNDIKAVLDKEIHERFDHAHLNEVMYDKSNSSGVDDGSNYLVYYRPTAEQIAWFIFHLLDEVLSKNIATDAVLEQVDLWETPTSRATAKRMYRL